MMAINEEGNLGCAAGQAERNGLVGTQPDRLRGLSLVSGRFREQFNVDAENPIRFIADEFIE